MTQPTPRTLCSLFVSLIVLLFVVWQLAVWHYSGSPHSRWFVRHPGQANTAQAAAEAAEQRATNALISQLNTTSYTAPALVLALPRLAYKQLVVARGPFSSSGPWPRAAHNVAQCALDAMHVENDSSISSGQGLAAAHAPLTTSCDKEAAAATMTDLCIIVVSSARVQPVVSLTMMSLMLGAMAVDVGVDVDGAAHRTHIALFNVDMLKQPAQPEPQHVVLHNAEVAWWAGTVPVLYRHNSSRLVEALRATRPFWRPDTEKPPQPVKENLDFAAALAYGLATGAELIVVLEDDAIPSADGHWVDAMRREIPVALRESNLIGGPFMVRLFASDAYRGFGYDTETFLQLGTVFAVIAVVVFFSVRYWLGSSRVAGAVALAVALVVALYALLLVHSIGRQNLVPQQAGLRPTIHGTCCSQALMFDRTAAARLRDQIASNGDGQIDARMTDTYVFKALEEWNVADYTWTPSLFQHIGRKSSLGHTITDAATLFSSTFERRK